MRCKNCGSQNDDNLYICQNCGSPLYDEDEIDNKNDGGTMVFGAVSDDDEVETRRQARSERAKQREQEAKEKKKKQQIIILIIVLAIILIAIVTAIIVAVAHNNKTDDANTLTTVTTTIDDETTTEATTRPTTTTTTTETTTTTTTTTTTQASTYTVSLSCNEGGEVEGDGTYSKGETVMAIARPDDGYVFDGWYKNGNMVSSNATYKFKANGNTSLTAKFIYEGTDQIDGETD